MMPIQQKQSKMREGSKTTPQTKGNPDETTGSIVVAWIPKITTTLNHVILAVAKHWLLIINVVIGLYAILPILAPVLMVAGHESVAWLIYAFYRPLCHQLPERSFFLFGPQLTYTLDELRRLIGSDVPLRYIGNPTLGYKVAVCQRDIATYLAALLAGLAFAPLRHWLRPPSIRTFAVLCLPMAVDGLGQLLALWDSTWWSRVSSGALFGLACVWLAYPYIEDGMNDVLRVMHKELDK